jgi:hypothetical protein
MCVERTNIPRDARAPAHLDQGPACTRGWPARACHPSSPICPAQPAASNSPRCNCPTYRRGLDSLIALISDFDREIAETTSEIAQRAKGDERVKLLCQVRGIGGDLITGELRLDLRRWRYGASHGKGLQLSGRT